MNLAGLFNAQFIDTTGVPLDGGKLYTYISGTTTNQTTYSDEAGTATNTNPIILNSVGRCDLWLDPALTYTLLLKRSDNSTVDSWDDVVGCVKSTDAVASINGLSGVVVLEAQDIDFATGTSTTWFVGTDVAAALDAIIEHAVDIEASVGTLASSGPSVVAITYAATISVNVSGYANNSLFRCALTGNVTVNFTGGTDGQTFALELTQDPTGSRLVTLGTGISYGTTITGFTATTTANKCDTLFFMFNNASSGYRLVNVAKGFT